MVVAALAALGYVLEQHRGGPGVPVEFTYRGSTYVGLGNYDDPNDPTPTLFCFARRADATGGNKPLPRGYAPFRRVGVLSDFPAGSRVLLASHHARHGGLPTLVMVRDGGCFRAYSSWFTRIDGNTNLPPMGGGP
jgi:hypothetical protein